MHGGMDRLEKRLGVVEQRLENVDQRLDSLDATVEGFGERLDQVEHRIAEQPNVSA